MDSKKSKFKINSYILYKNNNSWYEGRLQNIIIEEGKEVFHLFSLYTFAATIIYSAELLTSPTAELRKKIRTTAFTDIPNRVHLPALLKNVIIVDKEWVRENRYDFPPRITVSMIINHFKAFLTANTSTGDSDEIREVAIGFARLFNEFLPRVLLYKTEKEQHFLLAGQPAECYGPVYLLRLLYFIQKQGRHYIKDSLVAEILLDYTIYMLDFLLLRYKDYF